ncbi:MAG: hypothetical protein HYT80_11965 [Euryarchaeota archaeon]|nr:hypothetical protein [Euryarchaeota archaeon]
MDGRGVEFEAVFGDRLPLRDGRVAINLSGESPLVVTLEPHLISKAMRRPGSAPTVRAVRPMGNAPSEYSQTFHAKVQALYRDPSPMAAFPLNTTLSSQNFTFPRSSGDAPVAGSFQIEGIDHVIEVRPRLRYDCPYQSGGANLTFTDAFGRSFVETFRDYGTSPSTYRVCVLSEAQQFSSERRQVLWDGPGTWEFRSGGTCACRLWLEVVREDWAGLE